MTTRGDGNWYLKTIRCNEARSEIGLVVAGVALETITGEVRGPYCEYSTTLTATYRWTKAEMPVPQGVAAYRVAVEESCLWEPAHPFLYRGHWQSDSEEPVEYYFGWRVLSRRDCSLFLNSAPLFLRGMTISYVDDQTLRRLHEIRCNLAWIEDGQWSPLTDEYGPFVFARLPDDAVTVVKEAGPRKPSIAAWIIDDSIDRQTLDTLRRIDPTTLFAQWKDLADLSEPGEVDLYLVRLPDEEIPEVTDPARPWIAVFDADIEAFIIEDEEWTQQAGQWDERFGSLPGCAGWLASNRGNGIADAGIA